MSETAKHRSLALEYCQGNGVDLGSAGDPIVPWAIQIDLPVEQYHHYNTTRPAEAIHWRGDARQLPFQDETLDFVHASHLIEDFEDWGPVLREWSRVLRVGGYLLIAVPDHERFRAYVRRGAEAGVDCDNLSHRHEGRVGELTERLQERFAAIRDDFVSDAETEYSILYIGRKVY